MKTWENKLPIINLSGYNPETRGDMGTSVENSFFETSAPKGNLADCIKNDNIIIEETFIDIGDIHRQEYYFLNKVQPEQKES
jgi:hypothetical protein